MRAIPLLGIAAVVLAAGSAYAQQTADLDYNPPIARPAYAPDQGPVVAIDEAHGNLQTLGGQFQAFAALLRRDGFRVRAFREALSAESLKSVDVLVIGDPSVGNLWGEPAGTAYGEAEVAALHTWVKGGGALLLILDHGMHTPLAGAPIAQAFGVTNWHNGYAMVEVPESRPAALIIFRSADSAVSDAPALTRSSYGHLAYQGSDAALRDHAVTRGRGPEERVSAVMTFVGSAFQPPAEAAPLLILPQAAISLTPDMSKQGDVRSPDTPRFPVPGWAQAAVLPVGKGRVALFGEAAMFSAQRSGPTQRPMGMNEAGAAENYKLVLNLMRWLSGLL